MSLTKNTIKLMRFSHQICLKEILQVREKRHKKSTNRLTHEQLKYLQFFPVQSKKKKMCNTQNIILLFIYIFFSVYW